MNHEANPLSQSILVNFVPVSWLEAAPGSGEALQKGQVFWVHGVAVEVILPPDFQMSGGS